MAKPKRNINALPPLEKACGVERQLEIYNMPFDKTLYTPKPVTLKDIDDAFKEWAESIKIVSEDGTEYPTMSLYSNQRFAEYSQTWSHTDNNNNLLLNFKTVTRDNNPQYGNIHKRLWNIPGERFYTVKKFKVLDDNGTESLISVSARQPMAADLNFKLSIFTNIYEKVNEFNTKMNKLFQARQSYLAPNGYYMPMVLESIGDESEYSIDDRQFYSQSYSIKLMGFILEEKDFKVTQIPLKSKVNFSVINKGKTGEKYDVAVDIEICNNKEKETLVITLNYPVRVKTVEFVMDTDFKIDSFEYDGLTNFCKIYVNGNEVSASKGTLFKTDDKVKIDVVHRSIFTDGILKIIGHDPTANS